jgi:hypothetical protein
MSATHGAAPAAMAATLVRRGIVRTRAAHRPCPSLFLYPGLLAKPFWSLSSLPSEVSAGIANVVASREELLQEYDALSTSHPNGDYIVGESEHTLNEGKWLWHSAIAKGRMNTDFAIAAPKTMAALASVPSLLTGGIPFAYAFFSNLHSGSRIAPHFGPSNTRLRVHVPLRVPDDREGGTALTVAGETREWRVGEALIFDDSFEHKAENINGKKQDRLVLLFDLWHPDLSLNERASVEDMFNSARREGWLKN